jgi:hypothetical protein
VELRRRHGRSAAWVLAASLALVGCGGSGNSGLSLGSGKTAATAKRAPAVAVTVSQLRALAASAGHPIYWAGRASGTYELTRIADGRTYLRYLPAGVQVGAPQTFLTIGTYLRPTPPYATVRQSALTKHATIRLLSDGGLAVQYRLRPESVYLVFPAARYVVEVYDPSPATALRLATTGKVTPIR